MNGKRIIGFILIIGAIVGFARKFLDGTTGQIDLGLGVYFVGIIGLIILLAIRRILRS